MTRVLILGGGVSGKSAARLASNLGMAVTIYDSNPASVGYDLGVGVASGEWDRELLTGIDLVVASPGFSERSRPIVESLESGLPIWSEIEFAWRQLERPIAAITGTNGKTSVTEATAAMLDASGLKAPATGNIGAPLSDYTDPAYDCLVVEVSSFQLRFTEAFHPSAAAITNVAVDHLDWHGSVYSYRDAKARIYANQTETDLLAYDIDDEGASELASNARSRRVAVSGTSLPAGGVGVDEGRLVFGDVTVDVEEVASDDPVHLVNLAFAGILALELGATAEGVTAGARTYTPGAHRRQVVAVADGVTWVNDSKATNPHAAQASIRAHHRVILIAGGLAKSIDVTSIVAEPNIEMVVGIGEAGPALVAAAGEKGRLAGTLEVAVEVAARAATEGDTVLLAPACASFDQFESYGARGDRFTELVLEAVGEAA